MWCNLPLPLLLRSLPCGWVWLPYCPWAHGKGCLCLGTGGPGWPGWCVAAAPAQPSNHQAIFLSLEEGKCVDKVWKNHIFHPLLNCWVMVAQAGAEGPLEAVAGCWDESHVLPQAHPQAGPPLPAPHSGTQPPLNSWNRSWPWLAGV